MVAQARVVWTFETPPGSGMLACMPHDPVLIFGKDT
jgi:hypothetical protein